MRSAPSGPVSDVSNDVTGARIHVGDLVHNVGAHRRVTRSVVVPGLIVQRVGVPEGEAVDLDVRLDVVPEGIVASGSISGCWQAECSRCLEPVEEPFTLDVHELFESEPVESETYLLDGDEIDFAPVVRDTVVPAIPPVPLCDEACRGLCPHCGIDRNRSTCSCGERSFDRRWSALDELRFD